PKLVVERGSADGPLEHDRKGRRDASRRARQIALPRLVPSGQAKMRDGESRESGLGLSPAARCTLVPNLAARSGGRAGERRNGGRMIVRFDLHDEMGRLLDMPIA